MAYRARVGGSQMKKVAARFNAREVETSGISSSSEAVPKGVRPPSHVQRLGQNAGNLESSLGGLTPFGTASRRIFARKNALHRCTLVKDVKCTTLLKSEKMLKHQAANELRQVGIVNYFTIWPRCATHLLQVLNRLIPSSAGIPRTSSCCRAGRRKPLDDTAR